MVCYITHAYVMLYNTWLLCYIRHMIVTLYNTHDVIKHMICYVI